MTLSPNQTETLLRFKLGLPRSMRGWPGLPYNMVDQRSIGALERKGLVESIMHSRYSQSTLSKQHTPCYRLTDAGRAFLETLST